jgi:hypothetical protein
MTVELSKIDFNTLIASLNNSRIATENNALYQTIFQLIKRATDLKATISGSILDINEIIAVINDLDFLTWSDESVQLPNSRRLIAGDNVTFDDTVANQRTVDVPLDQTFITEADETATLPNSRLVVAGTNITLDVSVPGQITINATSGSGNDHVVMSDGAQPPTPMDDGNGNFIYINYTP